MLRVFKPSAAPRWPATRPSNTVGLPSVWCFMLSVIRVKNTRLCDFLAMILIRDSFSRLQAGSLKRSSCLDLPQEGFVHFLLRSVMLKTLFISFGTAHAHTGQAQGAHAHTHTHTRTCAVSRALFSASTQSAPNVMTSAPRRRSVASFAALTVSGTKMRRGTPSRDCACVWGSRDRAPVTRREREPVQR